MEDREDASVSPRRENTQSDQDGDSVASYSVLLAKGDRNKYGIAYRVVENVGVVITGVIPNSPADEWNANCDAAHILCAGDTVLDANQQTLSRPIVDELLNSVQLYLHVQKTGPRWHITGEGADQKRFKERSGSAAVSSAHKMQSGLPSREDISRPNVTTSHEDEASPAEDPLRIGQLMMIVLSVWLPNVVLLGLFSDVGVGIKVYIMLSKSGRNMQGNALVALGSMLAVICIIYDWIQWKSQVKKALAGIVVVYAICGGAIIKSRFYPYMPLVIIVFHIPVFLGILRVKLLKRVKRKSFYAGVTASSMGCSLMMLTVWLLWMNLDGWDGTNRWSDATKHRLVMDSKDMYEDWKVEINGRKRSLNYFWDCDPDHKRSYDYKTINCFKYMDCPYVRSNYTLTNDENADRGSACARIKTIWFLVWTVPLVCAGIAFIVAIFCLLNGVLLNVTDTSKLEKVLKQFILMIAFLVFTMYVSTSVAGASMRLTGVIISFCGAGLVALVIWLYLEIGRKAITSQVRSSKLMQSLIMLATSDWVRATFLIMANALIPTFLVINMLNQWVRKKRGIVPPDEPKYTAGAIRVILAAQNWNWASILIKANYLVILYWTFSVGVAKLTYVFLSWLNQELLKVSFVAVIMIFFVIGFTMFMLPPVPGIPVYITSGIVLSSRARNIDGVGKFWGGMCIAIAESLVLKICAVCGQYCIGYFLGKSVKVQQLVSVDKVPIRAIEKILMTRGLNLPKVAILVGGPDWPTSVLCGVLRLNLFQCCLGTLPVIFVSAPCVIAGAFMANPAKTTNDRRLSGVATTTTAPEKEGEIWDTMSTTALAFSFLLQLAGMVLALYFIQEVVHADGEELAKPRKEHEGVAALTRKEADYVMEYNNAISWNTLISSRKYLICVATGCMLTSTFMFVLMDEACFRQFQVASKISDPYEDDGLQGNVLNIVLMPGWIATGAFFVASILHFAFLRWASAEAQKRLVKLQESRPPLMDEFHGDRPSQEQQQNLVPGMLPPIPPTLGAVSAPVI